MGLSFFSYPWSQYGNTVSCVTVLFLCLQSIRADIRPQVKRAANLVIKDGHLNVPRGFA